MNKRRKYKILMILWAILILICVSACQKSEIDQPKPTDKDPESVEASASPEAEEPEEGGNSSMAPHWENVDMIGLPNIVDTITEDDGNSLVLVNKLHTVSAEYYPINMVPVDGKLSTNQVLYFKEEAYNAYLDMLAAAKKEGLEFMICSTYRSYDTQTALYQNSLAQNGEAFTNTRSAYPGRSEHHTGLAVDITSKSMGYGLSQNFINYPEGLWINNHCSEYGFIIRYPKGKTYITGYDYEPWHLRYVGVQAAKEITASGLTLEEYLEA